MTRNQRSTPAYRLHKPSGQARVIIDGRHAYLGKFGSAESEERYHRLVAEWLASAKKPATASGIRRETASLTINELILAFWEHAKRRYVKNGAPTSEQRSFKAALRPVRQLYGREPVASFGPLALVACREKLIEAGICRKRINQHITRIRHVFKWGVARELVPETVWRACERADVPTWTPNQLRHNAATRIRAEFGIEAARIILGRSSAAASEIYAEIDREKAREIAGKIG